MLGQIAERPHRALERVIAVAVVVEPVAVETAAMDNEVPERERLARVWIGQSQFRNIPQRRDHRDRARLHRPDATEQEGCGEDLADRADLEGLLGQDWLAGFDIGAAVPEILALPVMEDADRHTGDLPAFDLLMNERFELTCERHRALRSPKRNDSVRAGFYSVPYAAPRAGWHSVAHSARHSRQILPLRLQ